MGGGLMADDGMRLDRPQIDFVIRCLERWMWTADRDIRAPDPSHSALLYWLLMGNEPLEEQPPRSFSRPAHWVASGRGSVRCEFWEGEFGPVVNQCRYDRVLQRRDSGAVLLRFKDGQRSAYLVKPRACPHNIFNHRMRRIFWDNSDG